MTERSEDEQNSDDDSQYNSDEYEQPDENPDPYIEGLRAQQRWEAEQNSRDAQHFNSNFHADIDSPGRNPHESYSPAEERESSRMSYPGDEMVAQGEPDYEELNGNGHGENGSPVPSLEGRSQRHAHPAPVNHRQSPTPHAHAGDFSRVINNAGADIWQLVHPEQALQAGTNQPNMASDRQAQNYHSSPADFDSPPAANGNDSMKQVARRQPSRQRNHNRRVRAQQPEAVQAPRSEATVKRKPERQRKADKPRKHPKVHYVTFTHPAPPPAEGYSQRQLWRSTNTGPYYQANGKPLKVVKDAFFSNWLNTNRPDINAPNSNRQNWQDRQEVFKQLSQQELDTFDSWVSQQVEEEQEAKRTNGTALWRLIGPNGDPIRRENYDPTNLTAEPGTGGLGKLVEPDDDESNSQAMQNANSGHMGVRIAPARRGDNVQVENGGTMLENTSNNGADDEQTITSSQDQQQEFETLEHEQGQYGEQSDSLEQGHGSGPHQHGPSTQNSSPSTDYFSSAGTSQYPPYSAQDGYFPNQYGPSINTPAQSPTSSAGYSSTAPEGMNPYAWHDLQMRNLGFNAFDAVPPGYGTMQAQQTPSLLYGEQMMQQPGGGDAQQSPSQGYGHQLTPESGGYYPQQVLNQVYEQQWMHQPVGYNPQQNFGVNPHLGYAVGSSGYSMNEQGFQHPQPAPKMMVNGPNNDMGNRVQGSHASASKKRKQGDRDFAEEEVEDTPAPKRFHH
jgi:hypothetical protein